MKKVTVKKILGELAGASMETGYLIEAILGSGYGASRRQIGRKVEEVRNRSTLIKQKTISKKERHNFHSLLSYLKKDGLIEKKGGEWHITEPGKDKLHSYDKYPDSKYTGDTNNNLIIVAFDVPESERYKRDWLRSALKNMGLKMVQQSVWAGKRKLSKKFLDDLHKMNSAQYIDIFTVTKSGSLRSFKPDKSED